MTDSENFNGVIAALIIIGYILIASAMFIFLVNKYYKESYSSTSEEYFHSYGFEDDCAFAGLVSLFWPASAVVYLVKTLFTAVLKKVLKDKDRR